jgi:double-stranded uracil-DNA glycosylase
MLPDYLRHGLPVVFCGTAAGTASAERGHYYAGPGNEFWLYLAEAGLTPRQLRPEEDAEVLDFGIGLTDLVKGIASSSDAGLSGHYDVDGFVGKVGRFQPQWVAFHGKTAARQRGSAAGVTRAWPWPGRQARQAGVVDRRVLGVRRTERERG